MSESKGVVKSTPADNPATTTTLSTSSEEPSATPSPTSTTTTSEPITSSSPTPSETTPATTSTTPTETTSSTTSTSSSSPTVFTITSESISGETTVIATITETATSTGSTGSTTSPPSTATDPAALSGTAASSSQGLSPGGTIAVAVVVPVVSVALIILAAIFFWRKRKAKKAAEEERRKEVEEYGFNPNNDPTLPGMMAGSVAPKDDISSGYRGWGTTSTGRKASTNLSSGMGNAMSDGSGTYHHAATPSEGTVQYSDGNRPDSGEVEPIGVLGAVPVAANNRNGDIHRGPSNASSAYSAGNRSEASEESHMSATHPSGGYYSDNPYYGEMGSHGAYGDEAYQPVIRDVQARRNTHIENPGVYPRQGNAGIAQNF